MAEIRFLGERLAELREKLGIKPKDAAAMARIPYTSFMDIEKNAKDGIKAQYLVSLANTYQVSVEEIVAGTPLRELTSSRVTLMPPEEEIIRRYRAATPAERTRISDFVEGISSRPKRKRGAKTKEDPQLSEVMPVSASKRQKIR